MRRPGVRASPRPRTICSGSSPSPNPTAAAATALWPLCVPIRCSSALRVFPSGNASSTRRPGPPWCAERSRTWAAVDAPKVISRRRESRAQGVEQLALGVRHALDRAGPFEVHRAHGGDQPHVRVGPGGEPGDLAQVVHARLDDRVAVLGREAQQGERHAHLVVQIAFRLERRARRLEHRRDQLLGGGLAGRAGDAHHAHRVQALAPGVREPAQGAAGVRRGEERGPEALRGQLFAHARRGRGGDQDARRPGLGGGGGEAAAVVPLSHQRHEKRAADRAARIGERSLEHPIRGAREELRAGGPRGLPGGEPGAHRSASSARRASTRSSKLSLSVPTIW